MAGKNSVFVNNSAPSVDDTYLNLYKTENNNIITGSAQSLSDAISNQMAIGVSRFSANNFYIDSGSTNSYVLTLAASMTNSVSATVDYFIGMTIRFRAGNANTGASTVNVNSAGVKNLKKEDGTTDLSAGDIPTDRDVLFRYNGTAFVQTNIPLASTTSTQGVSYLPQQITIANGTDTDHDLNFTAFVMDFDDGSGQAFVSALNKQIDATWVAGTNQGGLDTGTVANNTPYYIFAIYNPTTLVSDILFSASRTSPTLPSGFTKKEYKGACHTDGSANIRNGQWVFGKGGYKFTYDSRVLDISTGTPSTTRVAVPISAPTNSEVRFRGSLLDNDASDVGIVFTEEGQVDLVPDESNGDLIADNAYRSVSEFTRQTNSSSQIYYRSSDASVAEFNVYNLGWKEYL
jgi:hypothetical protein